jgi:hypothetical protein
MTKPLGDEGLRVSTVTYHSVTLCALTLSSSWDTLVLIKSPVEEKEMCKLNSERFSFAHSGNEDGTFDSICPRCFQTLVRRARESDLQRAESSHVCDSATVEHYRWLSKAVFDYRVQSKGHVHMAA